MTAKYPDIEVKLSSEDGNAFVIIGRVRKELRLAGVEKSEIEGFSEQAMSGDYDNVLRTCMSWVTVS